MALQLAKPAFLANLGALPVVRMTLGGSLSSLGSLFPGFPGLAANEEHKHKQCNHPANVEAAETAESAESDHGIVYAVPKKKVSYGQKRKRQLADTKALKPLTNLNRCPACGHVKRMHTLCMHCFYELRAFFAGKQRTVEAEKKMELKNKGYAVDPVELPAKDEAFIYKKKIDRPHYDKLKDTGSYVMRYPRSQVYKKKQ